MARGCGGERVSELDELINAAGAISGSIMLAGPADLEVRHLRRKCRWWDELMTEAWPIIQQRWKEELGVYFETPEDAMRFLDEKKGVTNVL